MSRSKIRYAVLLLLGLTAAALLALFLVMQQNILVLSNGSMDRIEYVSVEVGRETLWQGKLEAHESKILLGFPKRDSSFVVRTRWRG
jgi:hypothetical protein